MMQMKVDETHIIQVFTQSFEHLGGRYMLRAEYWWTADVMDVNVVPKGNPNKVLKEITLPVNVHNMEKARTPGEVNDYFQKVLRAAVVSGVISSQLSPKATMRIARAAADGHKYM